jgi:hypothetical protein
MSSTGLTQQERDERIAELEGRLKHRSYLGVSIPVSVAAIGVVCFLLAGQLRDLRFFFAPRVPLILGAEDGYRFERLQSNRFVQIHGTPTHRGLYELRNGKRYLLVGLKGTPILVHRRPLPGEEQLPGKAPPQPDQRPFAVRGRLLTAKDASSYAESIRTAAAVTGLEPLDGQLWIVLEGERPRSDVKALLVCFVLLAFGGFNGWFLWRNLRYRFGLHHPFPRLPGEGA